MSPVRLSIVQRTSSLMWVLLVDGRKEAGCPIGVSVGGPTATEEYFDLAETPEQRKWLYVFAAGKGYVDFKET